MEKPFDFYSKEKSELEKEATQLKRISINLSVFRFGVFLTTCILIYLTFGSYPDVFIISFLGILLFGFLVVKHLNLQKSREIVDSKININRIELEVLNRNFHQLDSGEEFVNKTHFYSHDIDLFGVGSFFQYANRTVTIEGRKLLANAFTENKINGILEKQNTIKELANKVKWRQHFSALASLIPTKDTSGFITDWILNYTPVLSKYLTKIQIVFSIISLSFIGLVSFGIIPFSILLIWFFIGLFVTGIFLKKTSNLYSDTDKVRETFKQYHVLLNEIENEFFSSLVLKEKQKIIS